MIIFWHYVSIMSYTMLHMRLLFAIKKIKQDQLLKELVSYLLNAA